MHQFFPGTALPTIRSDVQVGVDTDNPAEPRFVIRVVEQGGWIRSQVTLAPYASLLLAQALIKAQPAPIKGKKKEKKQ